MADNTEDTAKQALQEEKANRDLRKKEEARKSEATDNRDPGDWALL
jgi:hypothetical protein